MRRILALIAVLVLCAGCVDSPGIAIPTSGPPSGAAGGTEAFACNAKVRTDLPPYGVIQPADVEMPNWTAVGAIRHWPDGACPTQPDYLTAPAVDCRLGFPWMSEPAFVGHGGRIRLDTHLDLTTGSIDETLVYFARVGAGETAMRTAPPRCAGVLLGSINQFTVYQMPTQAGGIVWVATSSGVGLKLRVTGQAEPAMPFLTLALHRAGELRDPGLREQLTAGGEACLSAVFRNLVCGPN